jgi:hypothetical protein
VSETLLKFMQNEKLDEIAVMNALQDAGICSDVAVWARDVGNGGACLAWLVKRDLRPFKARNEAA